MTPEAAEKLALEHKLFTVRWVDEDTCVLVCPECCKPYTSGKRSNAGVYNSVDGAKSHARHHKRMKSSQRAQRGREEGLASQHLEGHADLICQPSRDTPHCPMPDSCTGGPVQDNMAGHSSWWLPFDSQKAQHAHMLDSLQEATTVDVNDGTGTSDPAPNVALDSSSPEDDNQSSDSQSDSQSGGVMVDSVDSGLLGTVDEVGIPIEPDEAVGPAREARKGSAEQLHKDRLKSIADGHPQTSLQAAYSLVEAKECGASNTVIDIMAMHQYLQLTEPANVSNVNFPKSHHLVKAVLGTEDAQKYEFGCCPKCAWRYEADPHRADKSKVTLLKETCPQCAHPKYQVLLLIKLRNGSTVL